MGVAKLLSYATILVAAFISYLAFAPNLSDINPNERDVKYFQGPLDTNEDLSRSTRIHGLQGPESIVIHEGVIYTGVATGEIVAIKGETITTLSTPDLDSRVLGLRLHKGNLLAVDVANGVYQVDLKTGKSKLIISTVDKKKMLFPDDLDVDDDGTIYLSDVSQRFDLRHIIRGFLEHDNTGRVIVYDPTSKEAKVLVDGLKFPNGLQISHDKKSLLIAETIEHRIMKYHLKGSKKGQLEIFSAVPGEPDNVRPSSRGGYWVSLNRLIDHKSLSMLEKQLSSKIVRKIIGNFFYVAGAVLERINTIYPTMPLIELEQKSKQMTPLLTVFFQRCAVVELDAKGKIIRTLQSSDISHCGNSQVNEHEGHLYIGYYANPYITKIKL